MIYMFQEITRRYFNYNIQAYINHIKISNKYISIILRDVNEQEMELIAFGNNINELKKLNLKLNEWYIFKHIQTIPNNKFKRTNHQFKLNFKSTLTEVKLIKAFAFVKNNKIFVEETKSKQQKKKDNNNAKSNQLSIINFININ